MRRGLGISDAEWDAIKHLPGRWHTLGDGLCRVFYSQKQKGWCAVVYGRPSRPIRITPNENEPMRFDGVGRTVIGCYQTPDEALRIAGVFYDVEGGERLCRPAEIERVRRENAKREKSRSVTVLPNRM